MKPPESLGVSAGEPSWGLPRAPGHILAGCLGEDQVTYRASRPVPLRAHQDRFSEAVMFALKNSVKRALRPLADALLASSFADGSSVQDVLNEANATIGEKIEVKRVARLEGGTVVSYLHKTSPDLPAQIGVLFATEGGDEQVARDVAMHIAAFSPSVLTREEVDAETVENERRVAEATAKEEGKPEAALPKIVEGRVNGFFKENVLLEQPFAKDAKKTVAKVLEEAGAKATSFARFRVGG